MAAHWLRQGQSNAGGNGVETVHELQRLIGLGEVLCNFGS
jgi:hypothetical protein